MWLWESLITFSFLILYMWLLPPTPYTRAFRIFSLSLFYWKFSQCDLGWIFKIHLIGYSIYPFQTAYLYPFQFGEISLIISTLRVLLSFLLELLLFMCWNSRLRFTFYYLFGVIFHLFCSTFCKSSLRFIIQFFLLNS